VPYVRAQIQRCLLATFTQTKCEFCTDISEMLSNRSALAKVNGQIWDMHRPLEADSQLTFLHFKDTDPTELNLAYWRSCAFILGYVLEKSFKDTVCVELISPTNPHSNLIIFKLFN
jgi:large subunit ribosomal protein L39